MVVNLLVWKWKDMMKIAVPDTSLVGFTLMEDDGLDLFRAVRDLRPNPSELGNADWGDPEFVKMSLQVYTECALCSSMMECTWKKVLRERGKEWLKSELS